MISRKSSNDSIRTYCPVSERKLMQKRKNNHILLKHIHSKVIQHIRMEKFLEPYEVQKFIQLIKKLNIDNPDIETYRKKIRNMLLTINDSLMQFEQAVCSGEVALYSIDTSQNFDFSQQSSGISVGEVPSLSSIELTNTDFRTVPNNSQNCIELDYYKTEFSMKKKELPNNFICRDLDSKLNTVDILGEQNNELSERIKIFKKPSNQEYFKKSKKRNSKIKVNRSNIHTVLSNNKNINIYSSMYQDKKATEFTRKRKYHVKNYTSDLNQETLSAEFKILHIDPLKIRDVCETENINLRNEILESNNSIAKNKTKCSNFVEMNIQELCSQTEPFNNTNPVEPISGHTKENKLINFEEGEEYYINCISNDIPETVISLTCPKKKKEVISINSDLKEKGNISNNYTKSYADKSINLEDITTNNENIDNSNDNNKENQQFLSNCQQAHNTAWSPPTLDSTFFGSKNSVSQKLYESYSGHVVENYTHPLGYHKNCQNDNISEAFTVSQDLFPFYDIDKKASTSAKLDLSLNEPIKKQQVSTSDYLLAIYGELISQRLDNNSFYFRPPTIEKLIEKCSEMKLELRYGNIKKLREKMILAKEDCINTWNKFIQALEETKNDVPSLEFQKEKIPKGYKHHYGAMQKICDEYVNRFGFKNEIDKEDDEYVSIKSKMNKWSKFQFLVTKIKGKPKMKQYNIK